MFKNTKCKSFRYLKKIIKSKTKQKNRLNIYSLCCPVLTPQMVGGLVPSGLLTLKVSVRHWPKVASGIPVAAGVSLAVTPADPFLRRAAKSVRRLGPVMVKVSKSRRSWLRKQWCISKFALSRGLFDISCLLLI